MIVLSASKSSKSFVSSRLNTCGECLKPCGCLVYEYCLPLYWNVNNFWLLGSRGTLKNAEYKSITEKYSASTGILVNKVWGLGTSASKSFTTSLTYLGSCTSLHLVLTAFNTGSSGMLQVLCVFRSTPASNSQSIVNF